MESGKGLALTKGYRGSNVIDTTPWGVAVPLFGLEMWSDTGWVERLPLDLTQMDCGMPWGDWQAHRITVPLAWWVPNYSSPRKEFLPGTYRFVFNGGNMKAFRTEPFTIEP